MALNWVLHDVQPADLRPGDHIYRWNSPVHVQHGIVLEKLDGKTNPLDSILVLHVPNKSQRPRSESLAGFLGHGGRHAIGCGLKRARYGCPEYETWIKRSG